MAHITSHMNFVKRNRQKTAQVQNPTPGTTPAPTRPALRHLPPQGEANANAQQEAQAANSRLPAQTRPLVVPGQGGPGRPG